MAINFDVINQKPVPAPAKKTYTKIPLRSTGRGSQVLSETNQISESDKLQDSNILKNTDSLQDTASKKETDQTQDLSSNTDYLQDSHLVSESGVLTIAASLKENIQPALIHTNEDLLESPSLAGTVSIQKYESDTEVDKTSIDEINQLQNSTGILSESDILQESDNQPDLALINLNPTQQVGETASKVVGPLLSKIAYAGFGLREIRVITFIASSCYPSLFEPKQIPLKTFYGIPGIDKSTFCKTVNPLIEQGVLKKIEPKRIPGKSPEPSYYSLNQRYWVTSV